MSHPQLSQATQIRLPQIKEGLLKRQTRQQIAVACKVTRKTITRDIQTWACTDNFLDWIREVWLDKYAVVDDVEAFRQATKIIVKTIIMKAEVKEEIVGVQKIILENVTEDERSCLSRASRILDKKVRMAEENKERKRESNKLH